MTNMSVTAAYAMIQNCDTSDNQRMLDAINTITVSQDKSNPTTGRTRTPDGSISQSGRQGSRSAMEDRFICLTVPRSALRPDSFTDHIQSFFRRLVAESQTGVGTTQDPENRKFAPISTLSIACLTPENNILTANLGDSPIFLLCQQSGQPGIKILYKKHNTANPDELNWARQKGAYVKEFINLLRIGDPKYNVTNTQTGQQEFVGPLLATTRFIGPESTSAVFRTEPDIDQFTVADKMEPLALIVGSDGILEPDGIKPAQIFKAVDFYQKTMDTPQAKRPSLAAFLTAYIHGVHKTDNASIVAIDFSRLPQNREQTIIAAVADGAGGSVCADFAIAQVTTWVTERGGQRLSPPSPSNPGSGGRAR